MSTTPIAMEGDDPPRLACPDCSDGKLYPAFGRSAAPQERNAQDPRGQGSTCTGPNPSRQYVSGSTSAASANLDRAQGSNRFSARMRSVSLWMLSSEPIAAMKERIAANRSTSSATPGQTCRKSCGLGPGRCSFPRAGWYHTQQQQAVPRFTRAFG